MRISRMRNQTGLPSDQQHSIHEPSSHHGMTTRQDTVLPPPKPRVMRTDTLQHKMVSSTRDTTTTSIRLLGANTKRRYLLIQNTGASKVFLGFNVIPGVNGANGTELPAGSQIDFSNGIVPNGTVNAISQAASTLSILEGVRG